MEYELKPASDHPLPDLVNDLNLGFENYLVPIHMDAPYFLTMLRKDGLDLNSSRILLANGAACGIALIARRGWTSRLAAMGVFSSMRGKGTGTWFMKQLVEEAYERDDREMVLEVIEQNDPAVALYKRTGFEIVRSLVGFVRSATPPTSAAKSGDIAVLEEIDIRTVSNLISFLGLPDLPWQLSGETIAQTNPPARAYQQGPAYVVISNPEAEHVVIWSLLVEPEARGRGLGTQMLKDILARHPDRNWHVPAIFPEEFSKVFEQAGFERENLSQWQMKLSL